jgi:hypothetical protein
LLFLSIVYPNDTGFFGDIVFSGCQTFEVTEIETFEMRKSTTLSCQSCFWASGIPEMGNRKERETAFRRAFSDHPLLNGEAILSLNRDK